MTSYNLLNGEHTSQRRDLIMDCLRDEWGFQGLVMTDWVVSALAGIQAKYPAARASGSIKAGNDIHMPGSPQDYQDLLAALDDPSAAYPITRQDLLECAQRIIYMVKKLVK